MPTPNRTASRCSTYAEYRRIMRRVSDEGLTHWAALYAGSAEKMENPAKTNPARAQVARSFREACRAIEDEQLARDYERAHPEEL